MDDPNEDTRTCTCGNCDWKGPRNATTFPSHIFERVEPGEPMPAGECPQCGALVHLDEAGELAPRIVALIEAGNALASLLEDAEATHIYDLDNGDEQPEDCTYRGARCDWAAARRALGLPDERPPASAAWPEFSASYRFADADGEPSSWGMTFKSPDLGDAKVYADGQFKRLHPDASKVDSTITLLTF